MAVINIRVWDEEESVRISAESDPVFSRDDLTDAQVVALDMIDAAMNNAETVHSVKVTDTEDVTHDLLSEPELLH